MSKKAQFLAAALTSVILLQVATLTSGAPAPETKGAAAAALANTAANGGKGEGLAAAMGRPDAAAAVAPPKEGAAVAKLPSSLPGVGVGGGGPKVSCMSCQGEGDDCKSNVTKQDCDKCVKVTGIVDDVNDLPPADVLAMVPGLNVAGLKAGFAQYKGKKVTMRDCASQQQILLATGGEDFVEDTGCTEFEYLFGLKDCTACACKGDCK